MQESIHDSNGLVSAWRITYIFIAALLGFCLHSRGSKQTGSNIAKCRH